MQVRTQGASLLGRSYGVFHLTEDLRFAQHHRVESTGHPKSVSYGLVARERVGMASDIARF